MTSITFPITGDADADRLLIEDPLALLIGMLLDQQVPMEWAFRSPARLAERLGGRFNAAQVAAMAPEELEAVFAEKPALHRFPASMARRVHQLAGFVVERYDGRPESIWAGVDDGAELLARLLELPGYGDEKAKIFLALLAKRFGQRPRGWEQAAAPFSDDEPRSAADVDSVESLAKVRAWKKDMKAKGKTKQD